MAEKEIEKDIEKDIEKQKAIENIMKSVFPNVSVKDDAEVEKLERELEEQQKKERERQKYEDYTKCGVGKKYFDKSIDNFMPRNETEEKIKESIKYFVSNPANKILLFYGNYGTGKTHLACGILREIEGLYVTSQKLCIEYETGADFNAKKNRLQVVTEYAKAPMLVIDEVGRSLNKNLEQNLLNYIISERYANNLPLVLVTNLNKKEFVEYLGMAVFDRLIETCISLEFTGQSQRQKK